MHILELVAPELKSSYWSTVSMSLGQFFPTNENDVSPFHVSFLWIIPKLVPLEHLKTLLLVKPSQKILRQEVSIYD